MALSIDRCGQRPVLALAVFTSIGLSGCTSELTSSADAVAIKAAAVRDDSASSSSFEGQLRTPLTPQQEGPATFIMPETEEIPPHGIAKNFQLVGWNPLLDNDRGAAPDPAFDRYVNPPLVVPRGSNADITAAGDCVYVGSFIGYQTALIVDVSNPQRPTVIGEVPGLPPGVGNGIEGIEASDDLLVIDQRNSLGGLGFPVPAGMHARGIQVYDIGRGGSRCRTPRLVGRFEYTSAENPIGKNTHLISLWRDPLFPSRVIGLQSFSDNDTLDNTAIQVIDLTGCPQLCNPRRVAAWSARTQYGLDKAGNRREHLHEGIMSTDGNRIYMSQYRDGFFMLDSSKLIATLRGQDSCDATSPTSPGGGAPHCIKPLNADYDARDDSAPPLIGGWRHTPMRVPDRPYLFEVEESGGPSVAKDSTGRLIQPIKVRSVCPGSFMRMIYIGEDEYFSPSGFSADGNPQPATKLRGDLFPMTLSHFGTEEQKLENCGPSGFKPGTAPLKSSWFSPHDGLVLPNVAIITYYGAGVRAVDISNPYLMREVGYFINKPVETVRWASYGIQGEFEPFGAPPGELRRRPTVGPPAVFAFSYVLSHNGYLIYADVHSGLYVLKYTGPYAASIPAKGNCLTGNPGGVEPGYEPCAPYGKWDTPVNAWTETGVVTPPGEEPH
jgi:hypothetical protein